MKTGFAQFRPVFGDVKANVERMAALLASEKADLMVFPEMATSGYTFATMSEARSLAEPFETSDSLARLSEAAKESNCAVVVGFPEHAGDRLYNSAALLRPDGTRELYRKIHVFGTENLFFSPGDIPFKIHEYMGVKLGIIICFDWYFPESIRTLALMGAQIICQPSNLVLQWCQRSMITRSIENRVFTITANRYGTETNGDFSFYFTGASQMTSPLGDIIVKAQDEGDFVGIADIDPTEAFNKKVAEYSDLFANRRPEFYSEITRLDNKGIIVL